jgi:hypothetical protein
MHWLTFCCLVDVITKSASFGLFLFSSRFLQGTGPVQAVGGNTAMSILLTVTSNVAAIFTMPLVLRLVLATSCALNFDVMKLVIGLAQTVLLPLLFGASLRGITQVCCAVLRCAAFYGSPSGVRRGPRFGFKYNLLWPFLASKSKLPGDHAAL